MTSTDHSPVPGTNGHLSTFDHKHGLSTNANHIENARTTEHETTLDKSHFEAKVDKFGARSKTSVEEIALVKKLDRTILVRSPNMN